MRILLVNPPIYTFMSHQFVNKYSNYLYGLGTLYLKEGHEVDTMDMLPEMMPTTRLSKDGNRVLFDGVLVSEDTHRRAICGNWKNEKYEMAIMRTGLPWSMLEEKLKTKNYDKIIVATISTKLNMTSNSYAYIFQAAFEAVNLCKNIQPKAEVCLQGVYTTLLPDYAKRGAADTVMDRWEDAPQFTDPHPDLIKSSGVLNRICIATSLGCSNGCRYCVIPYLEGIGRRERPVEEVLDYMEMMCNKGNRHFRFMDSNLLENWDKHFKKICEGIILRKLNTNLTIYGGVTSSLVTDEVAELMKKAGFTHMLIPLESTNDCITATCGKVKTVETWKSAVAISKKYFDRVTSYLMVGMPGQKHDDTVTDIQFCKDHGSEPRLLAFTPLPRTSYEDKKKDPFSLHPALWPYAWEKFTVKQLEDLFLKECAWFKSALIPAGTGYTEVKSSPALWLFPKK